MAVPIAVDWPVFRLFGGASHTQICFASLATSGLAIDRDSLHRSDPNGTLLPAREFATAAELDAWRRSRGEGHGDGHGSPGS